MNKSNSNKIIISGAGCAITDLIYNRVSFASPGFQQCFSKQLGDGGLSPCNLVLLLAELNPNHSRVRKGTGLKPFRKIIKNNFHITKKSNTE